MHELVLEPECSELTRLHPSTRQRLEKRGQFPKSFKIGDQSRTIRFPAGAIACSVEQNANQIESTSRSMTSKKLALVAVSPERRSSEMSEE
jgi:predicted DNA-binding transcriptional regulator AlpA